MLKFAVQIRIRFFNLLPSLGRNFTLQLLEGAVLALAVASGSHQDLWHYNQSSGYIFFTSLFGSAGKVRQMLGSRGWK